MSNRAERRRAEKLAAKGGYAAPEPKVTRLNRVAITNVPRGRVQSEVCADEKLVACAIMHADGTINKGFKSHWELRSSLDYEDASRFNRGDIPGFWTSKDRFVERNEAMNIAFHAGQIRQPQEREFLSSDVDVW